MNEYNTSNFKKYYNRVKLISWIYAKRFLQQIRWYEWLYMFFFEATIITLGCVFGSNALVIICSALSVLSVFLTCKGIWVGALIGAIQAFMYCFICLNNQFYGEIISNVVISIPSYLISVYTWAKNANRGSKIVKVSKKISWKEWLISATIVVAITVAFYFILEVFNTRNLIWSTISLGIGIYAYYMMMRRCEYMFIFYIVANVVGVMLWIYNIINIGDMTTIPMLARYFMFFALNIYGFINWINMRRKQNKGGEKVDGTSGTSR